MTAHFHQFPCRSDNYGVLVHDSATGATAAIDAPEAGAVLKALEETRDARPAVVRVATAFSRSPAKLRPAPPKVASKRAAKAKRPMVPL